jgi:hypothetical protein
MDMNVVHMEKVGYIILPYNMDWFKEKFWKSKYE